MNDEPVYRLVTYEGPAGPRAGVLMDDLIYDAARLVPEPDVDAGSMLGLLRSWPLVETRLREAVSNGPPRDGLSLSQVSLLAPVPDPSTIFCAGANYWDHLEEMEGSVDRDHRASNPWFFVKTGGCVVGDGVAVHGPTASHQLDWEAELAVVIGRQCRDIPAAHAREVIAGYLPVNDLSARDLMTRSDRPPSMTYDWVGQKCFDGALPSGPWLTPASAVSDPHDLAIRLWVNGELKQDSTTANLVHDIDEQIEWLSHQLTLQPGDIICTGTPAGVGLPRNTFLEPGDVVRVEIDGCGTLTTPIIAAPSATS